jgi:hypothetical protein
LQKYQKMPNLAVSLQAEKAVCSIAVCYCRQRKVGAAQSTILPNGKVPLLMERKQQVPQKITVPFNTG